MSKPTPLQLGKYYHIYNRGNNREDLFIDERNYHYFMRLYAKYTNRLQIPMPIVCCVIIFTS